MYYIYFDESNKLDQPSGSYAYYCAFGSDTINIKQINKDVNNILNRLNSKHELHFVTYTSDSDIKKYFQVLDYLMGADIHMKLFLVDNQQAQNTATKMKISMSKLRDLFYVKIPERLFYGITRNLDAGTSISLYVDDNDEYVKLDLYGKLLEQMNAHSAYRNKCYKIEHAEPQVSNESIPLQLTDIVMGIIAFIFEDSYLKSSVVAKVKSDLIYRFLIEGNNIKKFLECLTIFKWDGSSDQITEIMAGEYISKFIVHKSKFDIERLSEIAKITLENPQLTIKALRIQTGYPNAQFRMLLGYLDELRHHDRNFSIR